MTWLRAVGPLVAAAAASGVMALLGPRLPITSTALQDVLAVAYTLALALVALHVSARGELRGVAAWGVFGAGILTLVVIRSTHFGTLTVPVQVLALLAVARTVGAAVGSRVERAGHVLPATVVAAAADCASLLTPGGPSNAIMEGERYLTALALAAPVPGTAQLAFVLGIGDLVMIALLLAVARKFGVTLGRVTFACAAALIVAFAASAWLERPIPALVPIAFFANVVVPSFRRVPKKDQKVAVAAGVVACGLLVFVIVRAR